ncbi:response regulator transcription factor [Patescibacteria group bacterium]|nr:response regulator transcription factor [Patescibacteria group bacterium]MCL5797702.1 response regulator transcription factor [Patescibacteria group bacterium]
MRILVIEDEAKLNLVIKKGLQQKGYAVDSAFNGKEGELFAENDSYDLIVLDVMLPEKDGLTLCKSLRSNGIHTPVLFLTAKDTLEDKIAGLDSGGDDYIIKPFEFSELLARVRALLRRPRETLPPVLKSGNLVLDTRTQTVKIDGKEIKLTLREFRLLEYLLRNKNIALEREQILDHVWDMSYDSFSNAVDVHIKNLRKKLKSEYAKKLETVRGIGYKLKD